MLARMESKERVFCPGLEGIPCTASHLGDEEVEEFIIVEVSDY